MQTKKLNIIPKHFKQKSKDDENSMILSELEINLTADNNSNSTSSVIASSALAVHSNKIKKEVAVRGNLFF